MQKIGDHFKKLQGAHPVQNSLFGDVGSFVPRPPQVGPKGRPIAELRFKDELPKIITEFGIKAPADLRLWKQAKKDYAWIEMKVANIRESMEADRKKGIYKKAPQYAGLLLWMIFPKKHKGD